MDVSIIWTAARRFDISRGAMAREFRSVLPYLRFRRIRPNLQQDYLPLPHNFT
jgi:hypothetical protein